MRDQNNPRGKIIVGWITFIYFFGYLIDWAYWIATARPEILGDWIIGGFFLSIGWPVHLFVAIWKVIL